MDIAIELAEQGRGRTSPNPMVGALVVKDGKIIGRGFHEQIGKVHAEVNALNNAGKESDGATLICTLEPCSHFGKTPPCTDLIIKTGIKKVIIGAADPNPLVNGKGLKALKDAGIEVVVGVHEQKIKEQNIEFFKYMETGLPFVTLKVAVSSDGKISESRTKKTKISCGESNQFVHTLRAGADAILTGIGTVLSDDPMLNVRLVKGNDPLRVVLDSNAQIPLTSNIVKTAGVIETRLFALEAADPVKISKLKKAGVNVEFIKPGVFGVELRDVLIKLGDAGISSALVEAGAKVNSSFLEQELIDRLLVIKAPGILGGKAIDAFQGVSWDRIQNEFLKISFSKPLGQDILYDFIFSKTKTDTVGALKCLQA